MKRIKQNKIVCTCILLINDMLSNAQEIDCTKHYKYGFINKAGKEMTVLIKCNKNFNKGLRIVKRFVE